MERLAAVLLVVGLGSAAASAEASILCKTKKGGLVVRETCKKKEVPLDPAQTGLKGDKGDPGPTGPTGPQGMLGPPGGGLHVVDAVGQEVGLVTGLGNYGGSAAIVARQIPVDTGQGTQDEWFILTVDAGGFRKTFPPLYGSTFVYTMSDCTGTRFFQNSSYGSICNAGSIAPDELAHTVKQDPDTNTGYYARGVDLQDPQPHFGVITSYGSTAADAIQSCTQSGGQTIGTAGSCPPNQFPSFFSCIQCCTSTGMCRAAPVRLLKLSDLGLTPPFKLQR